MEKIYCTKCGAENSKSSNYCQKCGQRIIALPEKDQSADNDDSQINDLPKDTLKKEEANKLSSDKKPLTKEEIKKLRPGCFAVIVTVLFIAYIIGTCSSDSTDSKQASSNEQPPDTKVVLHQKSSIPYVILKESSSRSNQIFNADIQIPYKISEDELIKLSKTIRIDLEIISDNIRLFFYLPEMIADNGAWATTVFAPESDIKVQIIGQTIEQQNAIESYAQKSNGDYIGEWVDNFDASGLINRIRNDRSDGIILEFVSPTEDQASSSHRQLKKARRNGKEVFVDVDRPEEYYLIESNGDLTIYDNFGFIATLKKVK